MSSSKKSSTGAKVKVKKSPSSRLQNLASKSPGRPLVGGRKPSTVTQKAMAPKLGAQISPIAASYIPNASNRRRAESGPAISSNSHKNGRRASNLDIKAENHRRQSAVVSSALSTLKKTGFLTKMGGKKKDNAGPFDNKWQKRWFVLTHSSLLYFSDPKDTKPKGSILIDTVVSVEQTDGRFLKNAPLFAFIISTDDRDYYLYADTEHELRDWITAIRRAKITQTMMLSLEEEHEELTRSSSLSNLPIISSPQQQATSSSNSSKSTSLPSSPSSARSNDSNGSKVRSNRRSKSNNSSSTDSSSNTSSSTKLSSPTASSSSSSASLLAIVKPTEKYTSQTGTTVISPSSKPPPFLELFEKKPIEHHHEPLVSFMDFNQQELLQFLSFLDARMDSELDACRSKHAPQIDAIKKAIQDKVSK